MQHEYSSSEDSKDADTDADWGNFIQFQINLHSLVLLSLYVAAVTECITSASVAYNIAVCTKAGELLCVLPVLWTIS